MISVAAHYDPVRVAVTVRGEATVVAVAGELDGMVADRLRRHFDAALTTAPGPLVVDLTEVRFCSAAILRVLLEVRTGADKLGLPFALVGGHRAVSRPIELAGLGTVLRPLSDVTTAWDRLADEQSTHEHCPHDE